MEDAYTLQGRFSLEPPSGTSPTAALRVLRGQLSCWKLSSGGRKLVAASAHMQGTEFMNELDRVYAQLINSGWKVTGSARWLGSDETDRGEMLACGKELRFEPEPLSMLTDEATRALRVRAMVSDPLSRERALAWLSLARARTTGAALSVAGPGDVCA